MLAGKIVRPMGTRVCSPSAYAAVTAFPNFALVLGVEEILAEMVVKGAHQHGTVHRRKTGAEQADRAPVT